MGPEAVAQIRNWTTQLEVYCRIQDISVGKWTPDQNLFVCENTSENDVSFTNIWHFTGAALRHIHGYIC